MKKCVLWLFLFVASVLLGFILLFSVVYKSGMFILDFLNPISIKDFLSLELYAALLYVSNTVTHFVFTKLKHASKQLSFDKIRNHKGIV